MKNIRTVIKSAILLAVAACTACGGSKVERAEIRDLVLIYDGGDHRTVDWNKEHFATYVATDPAAASSEGTDSQ